MGIGIGGALLDELQAPVLIISRRAGHHESNTRAPTVIPAHSTYLFSIKNVVVGRKRTSV